jgi:hypothetical protein
MMRPAEDLKQQRPRGEQHEAQSTADSAGDVILIGLLVESGIVRTVYLPGMQR